MGDSETAPGCSQSTDGGGRVSNFKIMAVRRGFSSEGDVLLDYLEKGVFHALEKQYLRSFVLALYLVRVARSKVHPYPDASIDLFLFPTRTRRTRIISSRRTLFRFITTSSPIRPSGFPRFLLRIITIAWGGTQRIRLLTRLLLTVHQGSVK